jgi:hypothetical protein
MTTGAKVAIGCVVTVVLAGGAVIVVVGLGAWWAKGKVEEVAGNLGEKTKELERYQKKANANPFTAPADSVISEARLVKFIDVRKGVYAVYQAHQSEFERMKDKKEADLSDVMKLGGLIFDARLALTKGLADQGMNEEEYNFIVQQVYKSAWASAAQKETGKQPSEAVKESAREAQEQFGEAMKQVRDSQGQKVSEEDQKKTASALQELSEQAEKGAEMMRVPQANIDLFRKYEADLKKYTMEGLAIAGL